MTERPAHLQLSSAFEKQLSALIEMVISGERITIADASERTGIPADTIAIILATYYAVADEVLKRLDPLGQSVH